MSVREVEATSGRSNSDYCPVNAGGTPPERDGRVHRRADGQRPLVEDHPVRVVARRVAGSSSGGRAPRKTMVPGTRWY